jgi:hypothetical protein
MNVNYCSRLTRRRQWLTNFTPARNKINLHYHNNISITYVSRMDITSLSYPSSFDTLTSQQQWQKRPYYFSVLTFYQYYLLHIILSVHHITLCYNVLWWGSEVWYWCSAQCNSSIYFMRLCSDVFLRLFIPCFSTQIYFWILKSHFWCFTYWIKYKIDIHVKWKSFCQ